MASAATDVKLWESPSELDMSNATTLAWFIGYVTTHYPADRNILTLWDHGSGWGGVIQDNHPGAASHDAKIMTIHDLDSTIGASGVHFDLLQFEACMMGMVEVGYGLRNNVNVMVARRRQIT